MRLNRMLLLRRCSLVIGVTAEVAVCDAAVTAQRTTSATQSFSSAYRKAVNGINSCSDFKKHIFATPDTTKLIDLAINSGKLGPRSEYESTGAAKERIHTASDTIIGDGDRLIVAVPIGKQNSHYDADSGFMTVIFSDDGLGFPYSLGMKNSTSNLGVYRGVNSFGVGTTVKRQAFSVLDASVTFNKKQMPISLRFPINADNAYLFREALGTINILGRVVEGTVYHGGHRPTLDDPIDRVSTLKTIKIEPRCAVISDGPTIVSEWSYDNWD